MRSALTEQVKCGWSLFGWKILSSKTVLRSVPAGWARLVVPLKAMQNAHFRVEINTNHWGQHAVAFFV